MPAQKIKFVPVLNGLADLQDKMVFLQGFKLFSSIYSGLPLGYFDLTDSKGDNFIDGLEYLQVGVPVKLNLFTDGEDDSIDKDFNLDNYVIIKIQIIGGEDQPSGTVRVWFGSKLFLYKDMENRAYPPLDPRSLMKRVLEDSSRGYAVEFKDKNFDKIDGLKTARYKTMESDWEFLQKKVVPYSLSSTLPVFLYFNIKNEVFCKSFQSMMSFEPKALFTPKSIDMPDEQAKTDLEEFKSSNATIKFTDIMSDVDIEISSDESQTEMRRAFFLEDGETKTVISGVKGMSNKPAGKKSKGSLSSKIPIEYKFGTTSNGSSSFTARNHFLDDEVALLQGSSSHLDSFLSMSFSAPMNTREFLVGESVLIYIKKGHWLNGKWVITKIEMFTPEDNINTLKVRYTVARPTIDGKMDNTTLKAAAMLYSI